MRELPNGLGTGAGWTVRFVHETAIAPAGRQSRDLLSVKKTLSPSWTGQTRLTGLRCCFWTALWLMTIPLLGQAQGINRTLHILPPLANGWFRFDMPAATNEVLQLRASPDLVQWTHLATTIGPLVAYPDAASTHFNQRFYRAQVWPRTAANDWKNQMAFPEEPFRSAFLDALQPRWVKFAILTSNPTRVYYQDSVKYLFHYDYATARLEPFRGMNRAEFDLVSLHPTNQAVVLGAVLFPPGQNSAEFGIQFVGLEPYPAETVAQLFELVQATIVASPGVEALYLPTLEQSAAAEAQRDFFAARGIGVSSAERWAVGDALYAPGWALGRLKYFRHNEIAAAYADGRLQPGDILLTDSVPAEVPFVAGIISETAATPNSHVAILAQSYGVPFVHLIRPEDRAAVMQWTNREVVLRAFRDFTGTRIDVVDIEGQLDTALRADLLALKQPPTIKISAKTPYGAFSADTTNLVPADIKYFGGKAANFGLLRRRVPTNSPTAIAFSFDLWDAFMDQTFTNGQTLRAAISNRLAGCTWPPNMAALQSDLDTVRDWITDVASFNATLKQVITNALTRFDPQRKIRFRSSTNVEDSENFTGAGLYESYSGCLADDLDDDTVGPCRCDATEPRERGVFRALQKVYASLYADNAFLERLRYRVNEGQIGMGVLVHYSFPDEEELANGVATLSWSGGSTYQIELVTQDGPASVTNPDGSALPEIVSVSKSTYGTYLNFKQSSSLVPLGAYVLVWESEYRQLTDLLAAVADGYRALYPTKTRFILDYEYKKAVPGELVVKQVRELPASGPVTNLAPFLINKPADFVVFQGEYGSVFANHRLKSQWHISQRNVRLTPASLQQCLYTNVTWTFLDGAGTSVLTGSPIVWPKYAHRVSNDWVTDGWTLDSGTNQREFLLSVQVTTNVPATNPVVFIDDFTLRLSAKYAQLVPAWDYEFGLIMTNADDAALVRRVDVTPECRLQTRAVPGTNGVAVTTSFYWPKPPSGIVAGYTAPLVQFVETQIAGLTTEPLVLRDDFAQTYRPGHHNFSEYFLFEPRLDPHVSSEQRAELLARNVQLIYICAGCWPDGFVILIGPDGKPH